SRGITNDVAFPYSSMVRFKFPAQKTMGAFDLYWYDGGMKPALPDELTDGTASLPAEGMMLVGDKGKILAGFRCEDPKLIPGTAMSAWEKGRPWTDKEDEKRDKNVWIDAFLNKRQSPGNFLLASAVSETILLGTVAIRTQKRLIYDSKSMRITNDEGANRHFFREYRKGWEL
ncbi:MAG: gfo/Idh/MocA family oxidoreductase, partial [Bacteroidota bacterium]